MRCRILLISVIGWLFLYALAWYFELTLPASLTGQAEPKLVFIPPGTSFKDVANLLKQEGIIKSKIGFTLEAYRLGVVGSLKAGEYELDPDDPPAEILRTLAEGRVVTYFVTVPEGYNVYEIARLLDKAGLCPRDEFLRLVKDKKFLARLNLPGPTAEGFLFPDTYAFSKGLSCQAIIATMVKRFWEVWREFAPRAQELGLSVKEVVTLASIVEKEAVLPRERPLIAGVFWNRLKKGMPLQADPTVRYATKKFYRRLRKRDLRVRNPYNTYLYRGLPPGPICNPGRDSLRAVLYPAKTKYLYFVAKGDGSHHFSRTLAEHERAVDLYQRRRSWKKGPKSLKLWPEGKEGGKNGGTQKDHPGARDQGGKGPERKGPGGERPGNHAPKGLKTGDPPRSN